MSKHEKLKEHVYLFDMMAEKLGKDLEVAVIEGEISPQEVVDAAFRCSDCAKASTCAAVLPAKKQLSTAFDYCQNTALFARVGADRT